MLDFENINLADFYSLCFSFLELMISILGLLGGINLTVLNVAVVIGCYGG